MRACMMLSCGVSGPAHARTQIPLRCDYAIHVIFAWDSQPFKADSAIYVVFAWGSQP